MLGQSISRNSLLLGVFAVITTLLIAGTYLLTRDRIAAAQRQAEEKALLEIVPDERHDNNMLDDTLAIPPGELGLKQPRSAYIARRGRQAAAVILPVTAPDGYSGAIDLIVGVNRDGTVAGVRVLNHRETPGLGDKVDLNKSDWVLGFDGRSLDDPSVERWAVKKDGGAFDQFTGATITPRAVVTATRGALEYARTRHGELFADGPDTATQPAPADSGAH
ncbi:electron transport complex subunit RsxG [Parahaliea maris]|uniref:Ion-translocating oxidoreductase complex subunit G n=1 Tax=Parahaliea maris TaxID=2716870 RepID=A0A5C8ZWN8_9GAMM|nr:electron transport complex subunit RsxG [Parahaliea maris]TXS92174.1 electron transport complex subunit RsxG [Parahaliea maris]